MGPDVTRKPCGLVTRSRTLAKMGALIPSASKAIKLWLRRIRSTIFSPCEHGKVEARRWIRPPERLEGELPVLGDAPLRDIHAREHFDARDDVRANFDGDLALVGHLAVDAKANLQVVALGLEVDVARPVPDRAAHQLVEDNDGIAFDGPLVGPRRDERGRHGAVGESSLK